jgi:eukaryotic-like serine/threonine-protein kinase
MLGQTALGKYRLVRLLGQGSNADVFLAEPLRHGPPVVVKRIHSHIVSHPKFRQLFEAEVESMGKLCHPYAVEFLEAAIDDPIGPCLVLEYVPGITLEALLIRNRMLSPERAGKLIGYLCHALQAAHSAGIIHRDLKPANLMVRSPDSSTERIKVMDFGFAGFAARPYFHLAELTGKGNIHAMGTPAYVSPEMIRGDTVDHRSDLYAVGVLLYELLTGRLPFTANNIDLLLTSHLREPPPAFAKIGAKHLSPAIEAVVQRMLSKYPNERAQSARELIATYGRAIGLELWESTAPVGWEPPHHTVAHAAAAPNTLPPADPFSIVHEFAASMPERLAAAKLKGFVDDYGGKVIASEPGLIRIQLGVPERPKEKPAGSAIFRWLRTVTTPPTTVPEGQEPIELELHMEKPNPSQPKLNVLVTCRPLPDYLPTNVDCWQDRCDKLNTILRQYLGASTLG